MSNNILSYTSRDYVSIYDNLVNSISSLTSDWTSREETDPGIVLIKLMSMLGDMLSYNQDMKALEVYPSTVKERRNASEIFKGILGYKMHWYRSATCYCEFYNSSPSSVTIPIFTKILSKDRKICYTNIKSFNIPATGTYGVFLTQGIPVTPNKNSNTLSDNNLSWHTIYDWNITYNNIINNIYYLNDTNVDENNIILISNSIEDASDTSIEWKLVDDVDLELTTNYCFEFDVDEDDKPYIKLHRSWNLYANKFKLFYLISKGVNGSVSQNSLNYISSNVYIESYDSMGMMNSIIANDYISINNNLSTVGYDPETISEARVSSKFYRNGTNTLITLRDFKNAIMKINNVNNCLVTDCTCDPDKNFPPFTVKAYIVRDDSFQDDNNSENDESFATSVITELQNYKMMPIDIKVSTNEINYYYWSVSGELFLTRPCNTDEIKELLVSINNNLVRTYSTKNVEFNSTLKYINVISTIMNTNSIINYVDLNKIKYYDKNYNEVDKSVITGEHSITVPYNRDSNDEGYNPLVYSIELEHCPIKPGSIKISINSGQYIIVDDGNGNLISYDNFIRTTATVDYNGSSTQSGKARIVFELRDRVYEDLIVSYNTNTVNIIKYINLNTKDFNVNKDCIKTI